LAVEAEPAGRMAEADEDQGGVVCLGPDAVDRGHEMLVPVIEPFRVRQRNIAARAYQFVWPKVLEHDVEIEHLRGAPATAQSAPQLLRAHVRTHPFATAAVFLLQAKRRQRDFAAIPPQRLGEQAGIAGQPEAVVPENQIDGSHARGSMCACIAACSPGPVPAIPITVSAVAQPKLNTGPRADDLQWSAARAGHHAAVRLRRPSPKRRILVAVTWTEALGYPLRGI